MDVSEVSGQAGETDIKDGGQLKVFNISEPMKVASIWVVWAFLSIGALGWALFHVLNYFGVTDQAAWVQAIGSILAIVAAIAVAGWQKRHDQDQLKIAETRQRLDSVYALLALVQDQSSVMDWAVSRLCGINGYQFVLSARSQKHNEVFLKFKQHERNAEAVDLLCFGKKFVAQVMAYRDRAYFAAGIARAADTRDVDQDAFIQDLRVLQKFPARLRQVEAYLIEIAEDIESGRY